MGTRACEVSFKPLLVAKNPLVLVYLKGVSVQCFLPLDKAYRSPYRLAYRRGYRSLNGQQESLLNPLSENFQEVVLKCHTNLH